MLDNEFEFDEEIKDEYVAEMNQIKAPRELINKTKLAMRDELVSTAQSNVSEKVIKIKFPYRRVILAAMVIFVIGGSFVYYHQKDKVNIVAVNQNELSIGKNLGKINPADTNKDKIPIELIESEQATIIPDFMAKVAPSKLSGQKIQLGQDGNIYFAAFSKDNHYYFVTGKDVSQESFITFLKNKLENL